MTDFDGTAGWVPSNPHTPMQGQWVFVHCVTETGPKKETGMHFRVLKHGGTLLVALLLAGCAALNANLNTPVKAPLEGKRVIVFPFPDPFYKGRKIPGVGIPFSTVFVTKLQAAGVLAETPRNPLPSSGSPTDLTQACKYATEYD
jgi:hypothetical protein